MLETPASTRGANFSYAIARPGQLELIKGREIGPEE